MSEDDMIAAIAEARKRYREQRNQTYVVDGHLWQCCEHCLHFSPTQHHAPCGICDLAQYCDQQELPLEPRPTVEPTPPTSIWPQRWPPTNIETK